MNFAITIDGKRPQSVSVFVDSARIHTIEMKHFAVRRLTEMAKSRGITMDSGERVKPVRFDLEPGVPLIWVNQLAH